MLYQCQMMYGSGPQLPICGPVYVPACWEAGLTVGGELECNTFESS